MEAEMSGKTRKREEMLDGEEGFTFVELMVTLIVVSVLFIISVGAIGAIRERSASEALVRNFQTITSEARSRAISEGVNFGIAFVQNSEGVFARIYKDGDYDGILKEDIKKGKDMPVSPAHLLANEGAKISLPEGVDKDPLGNPIDGQDGVRFGTGEILTFTPKATATPGTLYIQQGTGDDGWAVRVAGIDGRIRIYRLKNCNWNEEERW